MNMNKLRTMKPAAIKPKVNGDEEVMDQLSMPFISMGKNKDYKTVQSKFHVLYIEKDKSEPESITIPFEKIKDLLTPEQQNKFQEETFKGNLELSTPEVEFNRFTLHIGDFMHFDGEEIALNTIIYELDRAEENDVLNMPIASDGGSIDEYLKLKNHVQSSFPGRITTICDPKAYSAGAMMFLCGDNRIVYEDCSMMFHTYKSGTWGTGKNQLDSILHNEERFNSMFYRELIEPGYMTEDEFIEYHHGKEFWLTFDKIIDRGIATHVYTEGVLLTVDEYKQLVEDAEKLEAEVAKAESEATKVEDVKPEEAKPEETKPEIIVEEAKPEVIVEEVKPEATTEEVSIVELGKYD
jgi:ATP-dependent protease ClpP protease subunit